MRTGLLLAALAAALLLPSPARAGDRLPGEAPELTPEVRAAAQGHVDAIVKGTGDAVKSRRELLRLGPVVWPVVENALRLTPPETARPHLMLLKALLATKKEPEFETLRGLLRRKFLMDDMPGINAAIVEFRRGPPDPERRGARLPLSVQPTKEGTKTVYRTSDGSIALVFGADGTEKQADAAEVQATVNDAGFVAGIGGRAQPAPHRSGAGAGVALQAPRGFAYAWASDGAAGVAPGGEGGPGGIATALGGAGQFARSGAQGANAK